MADEAAVGSIGDRVERAIERHADTAGEIRRGEREKPRSLRRNVLWLAVTLVSLYLVFPSLVETFSLVAADHALLPRVAAGHVRPAGRACARACGTSSGWRCARVRWRPVIAAQLASNALSNIAPGGGPVGAALQYRIFVGRGPGRAGCR